MILRVHLHNNNIPLVRLKLIKITNRNFSDLADKARDKHREIAIVDHEITFVLTVSIVPLLTRTAGRRWMEVRQGPSN